MKSLTPEQAIVNQTIVVWFSCGAASAVAAKKTIEKYGESNTIRVVNNPVANEHQDNQRFLKDCENWLGVKIETCTNPKWPNCDINDVFEKRKFMSGPNGAPCTIELKRKARQYWESKNECDYIVLGFTLDEIKRHDRFVLTEKSNVLPVLIHSRMTKQDCMDIIVRAGIQPPEIYRLGFSNANCIGCVKATNPTYWNHVRKHFPKVFEERSITSDRFGSKLVRVNGERIPLSELDPKAEGRPLQSMSFDCGIFCEEYFNEDCE